MADKYEPVNIGWILEKEQYHLKWFEGDQLPNDFSESLKTLSGMSKLFSIILLHFVTV